MKAEKILGLSPAMVAAMRGKTVTIEVKVCALTHHLLKEFYKDFKKTAPGATPATMAGLLVDRGVQAMIQKMAAAFAAKAAGEKKP